MILKVLNNLETVAPNSFLSNAVSSGASTIPIKNISSFSSNWAIQLGKTGEEQSEIKVISSGAISGTVLVTTANTTYDHPSDTPVYAIKYNQILFKRSTAGTAGTASIMTDGTVNITPDSLYTIFDDTSAASTYAYKTAFKNSVTGDVSADSDWITPSGFSFYSLSSIRTRIKNKLRNSNFIGGAGTDIDDVIDEWINEWLETMNNSAIKVNKDYSLGTVDVAFGTSGLGTITTGNFKEVRKFWVTYDGVNYVNASKMDNTSFFPTEIFNETHPYYFWQGDNVFGVKPEQSGGTARLVYYKIQTPLSNETDELPVSMRSYSKSFVDYGLAQASYLDGKDEIGKLREGAALAQKADFLTEITPRSFTGVTYLDIAETTSEDNERWL